MLTRVFDGITRLSLRFRWVVLLLALLVIAAGVYAAGDLNLELLPRIDFPQTVVVAQWQDSESADQFLNEITVPLEQAVSNVEGVVNVESTTTKGYAFIVVRNEFGEDSDKMLQAITDAAAEVTLPDGVEAPQILNFSLSDLPVVMASASSAELSLEDLKALVSTELKPSLEGLVDVSKVSISGGQELPDMEATPAPATVEAAADQSAAEDPGRLPLVMIEGAKALGIDIEYAQDVTPEFLAEVSKAVEDDSQVLTVLQMIPPELLPYAPAETLKLLPEEYISQLDPTLQDELATIAGVDSLGKYSVSEAVAMLRGEPIGQAAEPTAAPTQAPELTESPSAEALPLERYPLPESWVAAAAAAGQELATTDDLTPEVVGVMVNMAPQMLADLEPAAWRVVAPDALEVALPALGGLLEEDVIAQLDAIVVAGKGEVADAAPLPESWTTMAGAMGFQLETTEDVSAEMIPLLAANAPQLLADLDQQAILAFSPEVQAALPEEYVASLDQGLQETLTIMAYYRATAQAAGGGGGEAVVGEPAATPDPARLPDLLIQGAQSFGIQLEYAYDIQPDFMRQITAFGPQGAQILGMMSADNLRALQPEVIALLPPDFVDGLDAGLRAELDDLAAEFGGAGQLAKTEAQAAASETETALPEAPALAGPWLEPGPDGTPSQFQTAADLIDNPFVAGAATLLNFLPDSPAVDDPVPWMAALTPEVLDYLAQNEEGFVANLSPVVLEMMSPEALAFLLDNYGDQLQPDVAERLAGIAAGTVAAFIPEDSITRTDGNPGVLLSLYKAGDANTVVVVHRIIDAMTLFEEQNPEVFIDPVFEQASFIEQSISGVSREGALGAAFAILVVLVFLSGRVGGRYKLSWRATLVVGVSIPLSVFGAFLMMRVIPPTVGSWLNTLAEDTGIGAISFIARLFPTTVTLNIMTLSGLTVAVGRVVDDSIVVLENTYRFIQKGDDRKTSALAGTREVAIAIFSSTVTTVAVFLPLGLFGGLIGSFFLPFGLTVTYALTASFIVAITVVPALAYLLIHKDQIPEERESAIQRRYTPILEWALTHRLYTMVIATAIFGLSLFLLRGLPQSFIPEIGEPTVNVTVELPNGTQMADTDALVTQLEQAVLDLHGVNKLQTEIGSTGGVESFFGGGGVSQNTANATVSVVSQDDLGQLTDEVRNAANEIFGADNVVVSAASQASFGGFSLVLTGDSMDQLTPLKNDVEQALASLDEDADGRPDLRNVSSNIDETAVDGNGSIIRIDGSPAISFSAEMDTTDTLGVTAAAKQAVLALDSLPEGVNVTEGFESEQQTQGFRDMVQAIMYSIVIVYIILALAFRSLIHPFTILFSLPFALVGASLALWLSGAVLGISAMIGLMMLVGIVVTNAIVLLELVQQLRHRGSVAYDALVEGGRTRLRPIWMTALGAALALMPLAISKESGAIIASELAIVVIGGLIVSTALTLVVVPVVYSVFDQLGSLIRRGQETG
jgi:multidrug efflux pump subunit AcrB